MNLSWTVHPFKTDPKKAAFLVGFIILIAFLTFFSFNNFYYMILAFLFLTLAMRQFIWKTHYKMNDEGVEMHFMVRRQKRPWDYFKSYYYDGNGILLSSFGAKSPLESFRGMYLILPGDKTTRQQIIDFIKTKIAISQNVK